MILTTITILYFIYAILCIKRPSWGLYLIPLFLPAYLVRFTLGFVPFTFLEGLLLILIIIWFIRKLIHRDLFEFIKKQRKNIFAWLALALLAAATLSTIISPDKIAALGIWKAYFVEPILFYFVLIDTMKGKKDFKNILTALGISAFALSGYAIVQYFTGWGVPVTYSFEGLSRATSIFSYPAALGLYVAPIFVVISSFFIMSWNKDIKSKLFKNDLILIVALAVMGLALVASRAEGAWIGVVAAIFFTLMLTKYRWRALIIFLIFALVILVVPTARNYVFTLITFQDVSGDVRLAIWQGTWNLLKHNPIFGAGLAGFQILYTQYKEAKHVEISLYPHNMLLNFWVETGILGLTIMILLIFQYLKKGLASINSKSYKLKDASYKISLVAVMICILVYGLVDVPYFKNDLSVLFWIWVGLLSVVVTQGDEIFEIKKNK